MKSVRSLVKQVIDMLPGPSKTRSGLVGRVTVSSSSSSSTPTVPTYVESHKGLITPEGTPLTTHIHPKSKSMTLFNTVTRSHSVVRAVLPRVTLRTVHRRPASELVIRKVFPSLVKFVDLDHSVFESIRINEQRKKSFLMMKTAVSSLGDIAMLDPKFEFISTEKGDECLLTFTPVVLKDVDYDSTAHNHHHYAQPNNTAIGHGDDASVLTVDKYTIPVTQLKNGRS